MAMVPPTSKQSHPHFRPSRTRNVAQQPELRAQECIGVWKYFNHCQGRRAGGSGHRRTLVIHASGANGRHNEVNFNGSFDRFSGCEATMSARGFQSCVSIFGREPSLNDAKYGLRGVRVGEASNPGPQSRVRPRREDVAEDLLSSLEFELTMLDSSDDELWVRTVQGRHVIPRVGCRVPSTVTDSSAFPDIPPTVVESTVWPDAQIQASSDDGGVLRQTPTCSTIPVLCSTHFCRSQRQ